MTKQQFWRLCKAHDWTYMYSDDARVYRQGRTESEVLADAVKAHPELISILSQWSDWVNDPSRPEPPIPAE